MKAINNILVIYLFLLINVKSSTTISFSSSGDGYTVSGNVVTITSNGEYDIKGIQNNKQIIASSSCTINLYSFTLTNSGTLTPILVRAEQTLKLVLIGESTLQDSSTNENDGTIYLSKGASLIISGTGTLNINPYKLMAINGTDGTSLTVNDGPSINIKSTSSNVGGIYMRKEINFNNAKYTYSCTSGSKHAIDTEGTVKLVKGTFTINSGNGKGIQSETYLYIGEENGSDSDLTLTITTRNEGIEAKKIEIYSGRISITTGEGGINAASSGDDCDETVQCSGNCACYLRIKGGLLTVNSREDGLNSNGDIIISGGKTIIFAPANDYDQPIGQDGLLSITGGAVLATGSSAMGRITAQTTQTEKTYTGSISSGAKLEASDSRGNEIFSLTTPKAANYLYLNYGSDFRVTSNGNEIISLGSNKSDQEKRCYTKRFKALNILFMIGLIMVF